MVLKRDKPRKENSNNPRDWLFANHNYENIGIPRNKDIPENRNPDFFDLGLCAQKNLESRSPAGFDAEAFCGSFKTPTLRNVAVTGPYMHNGVFETLETVVAFYATRDTNPELWYPSYDNGDVCKFDDLPERYRGNVNVFIAPFDRKVGQQPRFNRDEGDALVAFLRTLTDR